ncbi:MAG: Multidrug resistance protein MdtK [Syntrophorhabdaceae bacterium PtaU1.Bin034]|nr:MAG: Multidrug resistance protein MdtK [Syntrophorhabdaceae bacterium PtaU1.Bin034]
MGNNWISLLKKSRAADARCFAARSWQVAWPMTLIMFFEFLIGLTDVYVAGRVGKDVQAAYGFVIQLYFIFIVVANALTVGTVSVVSRLYTAGEKDRLSTAIFSSLLITSGAGLVVALTGIVLAPELIGLLNIPAQLKPFCIPLVAIYSGGLLFEYLVINCNGILRSCNMIKVSLRTMAFVCGANITLNIFFVFFTPLGFRGIALATASSAFMGSLINLTYVRRLATGIRRFSGDTIKRIAQIGWPMGALQVLWQLGSMALFLIISELPAYRIEILAALTAGLRIESAIYLPAFAFNMANAVIVGNLLGEKKHEEAYGSGIATALIGVAVVVFLVLVVITNARWIASFLSDNPIVVRESVRYLYIAMISEPFMAWGAILGGGLAGAGDTRSVLTRVALSIWLVRLPLAYLSVVVLGLGAASVWWSMNISQFVMAYLLYRRYSKREWLFTGELA